MNQVFEWHISVYRVDTDSRPSADIETPPRKHRLAVWQADAGGVEWLERLVGAGQLIALGGNGYPTRFAAQAKSLLPRVRHGEFPEARATWHSDPGDVLSGAWDGKTVINESLVERCSPDDWLLIEAWDES